MATDTKIGAAQNLYVQGRIAEAEGVLREILRQEPQDVRALETLGVLVFQQGRTSEAANLFARALALDDNSSRLHANLGEALRLLGRTSLALEHLRRATALEPTLTQAWNSLGLLAQSQARHADARKAFDEALRLRPKFVPALINLANTFLALGQPRPAAEAPPYRTRVRAEQFTGAGQPRPVAVRAARSGPDGRSRNPGSARRVAGAATRTCGYDSGRRPPRSRQA